MSRLLVQADASGTRIDAEVRGIVFQDGNGAWISHCSDLDLSSCGRTREEAMRQMREAMTLFFESCIRRGTLDKALRELGWKCVTSQGKVENIPRTLCGQKQSDVPPAFMIDALKRTGDNWHGTVHLGN